MPELEVRDLGKGIQAYYRPRTSDINVLDEVITKAIYRRAGIGFDVLPGERWLDLGAHIGAFALYCRLKGATAECYEPDRENFEILRINAPDFMKYKLAITAQHEKHIPFWIGRGWGDHSRGTAYPTSGLRKHPDGEIKNAYGDFLTALSFDGVKMDIEGSEAGLLDNGFIPDCTKLCMEYHTSRDPSMENLKRRLDFLRSRFRVVQYPPEYDRIIAQGGSIKTFFDRMVYCIK